MVGSGERERETIRPQFDRSIVMDFQGAKITSDTGFLLLREMDERFGILCPIGSELEDTRSWVHSNHDQIQMLRQRVYQVAAGYEECTDADFLRIDPAFRYPLRDMPSKPWFGASTYKKEGYSSVASTCRYH